jgi:hypothetical protein
MEGRTQELQWTAVMMQDKRQGSSSWPLQQASSRQRITLCFVSDSLNAPEVARSGDVTFVSISKAPVAIGIPIAHTAADSH